LIVFHIQKISKETTFEYVKKIPGLRFASAEGADLKGVEIAAQRNVKSVLANKPKKKRKK
jgi:hypothetical protein